MQKQWLNYHHLLYFMTIANEGSVAKAAIKLRLGQSTLSTQLAQFEAHLGVRLFDRKQKRLHLTEAGRIALQYARDIFKLGDEMLDALYDRLLGHRISMQLGSLNAISKAVVASLIGFAQQRHDCMISVIEGSADNLLRALKAHEIDLALFNHQPALADRPGLLTRLVARSRVIVLGAARFSSLAKDFPRSLSNQPFILPSPQSRLRDDLDHYFKRHGLNIQLVSEAQDSELLSQLAERGLGLVPMGLVGLEGLAEKSALRPLGTLAGVQDELWLLASPRRIENPVASLLFQHFNFS